MLTAGVADTTRAQEALAKLCQTYWLPLYAYVRRQGYSKEDAEDLVQGFFVQFLERNYLGALSKERGRFRAFLLASLKHYTANEWNRAHRQKRGGSVAHFSLDWQDAEDRCRIDPADHRSPDRIYDREWAVTLLSQALARLREDCMAEGKAGLFDNLRDYLTFGRADIPYEQAGRKLGLDEGAVRVAVHRLRKRYRALVRQEVAETLSSHDQVEEEMKALFAALVD